MEFKKVLEERHSVRKFLDKEIPESTLQELMKLINSAPSAGNLQAFKVFVVKDKAKRAEISEACFGQSFVAKAQVVLVFCADSKESAKDYQERGERLYSIQDATIAATFASLAAVDFGLATCWVGAFDDEAVQKALSTSLQPVAVLPLGFPGQTLAKSPRKELKEVFKIVD